MKLLPLALLALLLTGCATATTAEYLDLKTGQTYLCYRQAAFGIIPAVVAGNSYADCKTMFEGRGFVRRDQRTDAILRHLDPKLADTLAAPATTAPAAARDSSGISELVCRQRADQGYSGRVRWYEAYYRCMAGY